VCDSKGVIYVGRDENMEPTKARFAQKTEFRTLADAVVGADIFLGLSTAACSSRRWSRPWPTSR
jgi:malate dehydrogenase (oxaloacetate-decarboxylating)(NADP+)